MDKLKRYQSLQYKLLYHLHSILGFSVKKSSKISETIEARYYTPNDPSGVNYDVDRMEQDYPDIFNMSKSELEA